MAHFSISPCGGPATSEFEGNESHEVSRAAMRWQKMVAIGCSTSRHEPFVILSSLNEPAWTAGTGRRCFVSQGASRPSGGGAQSTADPVEKLPAEKKVADDKATDGVRC